MKLMMALLAAGMGLLSFQTIPKKQTAPSHPKQTVVKKAVSVTPLQASVNRGQAVYLTQCLACHQADGGGVPNMNPPLQGAKAVLGKDKAKLVRIVLQGMHGQDIDGEEYHNTMAPHPDLTDRQIADVLTYVRNNWGNKAIAISAAEVKQVRAKLNQ
jgi:mono/diheme cytochrome c family protein